ncbi:MAG: DoxX family protein [Novosphingobium sp.]
MSARSAARTILALFYVAAGLFHLALPAPFVKITPAWVPRPDLIIQLTGIAELAGAAGLLQWYSPATRCAAGWGLAAYALCVWPANFQHMALDMARADHGAGLGYHVPRLAAQPLLIWLALWTSAVIDWPFRRHPS